MKTLRDIGLLFQRYTMQMLRNPVWLFVGFSSPILYLALFTPMLKHIAPSLGVRGGGVLEIFLPGILSLLAFASGSGMGFNTIFELQAGVVERFRVTPASRFAILIGPILSGLMMMVVFDAVVVAIAVGIGFQMHWLGLAALAVLLGLLAALDRRLLDGNGPRDQGHQQLRRDHQRDQPAHPASGRRAAPDLIRTFVDARRRALQPPLLRRAGFALPGRRQLRCSGRVAGLRRPRLAVRPGRVLGDTRVPQGGCLSGAESAWSRGSHLADRRCSGC